MTATLKESTPTTALPKRWLTSREAAEYLSVSYSTIKGMCHTRRIPYCKHRGVVRFDIHELDRWMEEAKHEVQAV